MAFTPVPNTCEIVPQFLWDGQRCANVHHVEFDAPPTVGDMTVLGQNYIGWWQTFIQTAFAPTTLSLTSVIVRDLTSANAPAVEVPADPPIVGTIANSLPNNVTLAVKWITALRGRSFRGRTFHVGLAEGHIINNVLTGAFVNSLQNAYDELAAALTDTLTGAAMVVVSKIGNGVPRNPGITTEIVAAVLDVVVDSQRRRLPGRGQ